MVQNTLCLLGVTGLQSRPYWSRNKLASTKRHRRASVSVALTEKTQVDLQKKNAFVSSCLGVEVAMETLETRGSESNQDIARLSQN